MVVPILVESHFFSVSFCDSITTECKYKERKNIVNVFILFMYFFAGFVAMFYEWNIHFPLPHKLCIPHVPCLCQLGTCFC